MTYNVYRKELVGFAKNKEEAENIKKELENKQLAKDFLLEKEKWNVQKNVGVG